MASSDVTLTHLQRLEAEAIHIIREVAATFENPVMLYSIGKDSAVMLRLAQKAFHPAKPPFPLMHVDTTWKFKEMIEFRDQIVKKYGFDLIVHINQEGVDQGVGPFSHGSAKHTDVMKTQGLKQALDKYQFDAAFGGARRDEEKSRAKERVYSFRDSHHRWDPKNQRPELWKLYNGKVDRYLGDGVVMLFGVPNRDRNAAMHCLYAARLFTSLVNHLHETNSDVLPLEFNVAAHWGPVLMAPLQDGVSTQYSLIGDAVHWAYHLASQSESRRIIASQTVIEMLEDGHDVIWSEGPNIRDLHGGVQSTYWLNQLPEKTESLIQRQMKHITSMTESA